MMQESFQITSSAVSDRGLSEKRPQNEDSYLEMPEKGLFAVADGVGGSQAGDVASQMAVEILAEAFNNLQNRDIEESMNMAITRANQAIYQMSQELAQLSSMATTFVALQVTGNIATIGHVGDSRLYRLDSNGNLFRETQDHSVVEEEVRAGRMTPQQAENHPSKNVISRALGADATVEIDLKTIMFEENTTFLLCSDGITRHIPDTEIREILSLPHPPHLLCGQMREICYERGAEDNLTAVIIRLSGSPVSATEDLEENTIASARHTTLAEQAFSPREDFTGEKTSAEDLTPGEEPEKNKLDSFTKKNPVEIFAKGRGGIEDQDVHIPARSEHSNSLRINRDEKTYYLEDEERGGGFLGKFILLLTGLVIGGLLGAAGYSYWLSLQPKEEIPVIKQMETPNIPFTTFEKNRREIDKNPQEFIKASGGAANDAEDFYLLGRAYLLVPDYPKSRESLEMAKKVLSGYKGENKAMLQNEIAIAYALAKNEQALRIFETEKANSNSATAANSNTVTNINPAANVNR